jgi:hypothetical protein
LLIWFCALLLAAVSAPATASFAPCERIADDPAALARKLTDRAVARAPARHHTLARTIRVVTTGAADNLMPFAGQQLEARYVMVPPRFVKVACQISLAEFMRVDGVQPDAFDTPSRAAARCLDVGGAQKDCLGAFATELERRYSGSFTALTADQQQTAASVMEAMLNQVVMHEFAHHFLDHLKRLAGQQVGRIDAEFEADLFAFMNGAQAGEPASALYYLFNPLSVVEAGRTQTQTPQYESAACRAGNVENITGQFGIVPLLLADAASGGGYLARNNPGTTRKMAQQAFAGPAPALRPDTCARIAKVALGQARQELNQLYQRMDPEFDWLFATRPAPDADRVKRLLADLSAMATGFRYMGGMSAKCAALVLRQWGLKGRNLAPLAGQAERMADSQAANGELLSEDLGRLLQAQGLATRQERTDLATPVRLQRADAQLQNAVRYNPAQSEAWGNLAFIAFKQGDCQAAAIRGDTASATATRPADAKDMRSFSDTMKELARDETACRRRAAEFRPYPGL